LVGSASRDESSKGEEELMRDTPYDEIIQYLKRVRHSSSSGDIGISQLRDELGFTSATLLDLPYLTIEDWIDAALEAAEKLEKTFSREKLKALTSAEKIIDSMDTPKLRKTSRGAFVTMVEKCRRADREQRAYEFEEEQRQREQDRELQRFLSEKETERVAETMGTMKEALSVLSSCLPKLLEKLKD
ncbi:MAG: hypothetical protein AAGM67_11130, partial [Bacteroidota bacterium]